MTGRCPCLVPDTAPLEVPDDLRPAVKDLVRRLREGLADLFGAAEGYAECSAPVARRCSEIVMPDLRRGTRVCWSEVDVRTCMGSSGARDDDGGEHPAAAARRRPVAQDGSDRGVQAAGELGELLV